MDRIREQLNRPIVIAVLGGVIGLVLGLVIGWGIWPVQWYDAAPTSLRKDVQEDFMRMTIESYAKNGDKTLAMQRWQELGTTAPDLLAAIQINPGNVSPGDLAKFNVLIQQGGVNIPPAVGQTQPAVRGTPAAAGTAIVPAAPVSGSSSNASGFPLTTVLVVLCLLVLVVGGALAYIFIFRNRRIGATSLVAQAQEANRQVVKTDFASQGQEAPVAQFMTTFMSGDDLYDDSFSIDAPSGEFLGECGVGISDTVGVGDPKKVTAFEVWLFDKNDIQTVTKVLMSEYAFNDPAIRQRLASKGEPVLIEPGQRMLLETATLQLEARAVDMNYGQGALPTNSFFERLTLELSVWPKTPAA
jgi:hypothetical protein